MKLLLLVSFFVVFGEASCQKHKCEPLRIKICQGLNYNMTMFPNFDNHRTQGEAELTINQIEPLFNTACSPDVRYLVCSYYAPICTSYGQLIPPCRSLCKSVKRSCALVVRKLFGYKWPGSWNCRRFPRRSKKICVGRQQLGHAKPGMFVLR